MPLTLGPDTRNPIQDRGQLVKIQLPYDLRPIGLAHTLRSTTLFEIGLYSHIHEIHASLCGFTINWDLHTRTYRLNSIPGTFNITIGGIYDNGTYIGAGAYGFVYRFRRMDNHNQSVILKFQLLTSVEQKIGFIKEGIIHHILYESTKYTTHEDCQYVPEFKSMFKITLNSQEYGVYIVGLCNGSYNGLIDGGSNSSIKPGIIQLARKLDRLWELYRFNHCDFHAENVLYTLDSNRKQLFLLNDFGFSQIRLEHAENPLQRLLINTKPDYSANQSRDLTHLITFLRARKNVFQNRHYPVGLFYHFGLSIVNDTLFNQLMSFSSNPGAPWWGVYTWANHNNNPYGDPITVLTTNNTVPYITGAGACNPQKIVYLPAATAAGLAVAQTTNLAAQQAAARQRLAAAEATRLAAEQAAAAQQAAARQRLAAAEATRLAAEQAAAAQQAAARQRLADEQAAAAQQAAARQRLADEEATRLATTRLALEQAAARQRLAAQQPATVVPQQQLRRRVGTALGQVALLNQINPGYSRRPGVRGFGQPQHPFVEQQHPFGVPPGVVPRGRPGTDVATVVVPGLIPQPPGLGYVQQRPGGLHNFGLARQLGDLTRTKARHAAAWDEWLRQQAAEQAAKQAVEEAARLAAEQAAQEAARLAAEQAAAEAARQREAIRLAAEEDAASTRPGTNTSLRARSNAATAEAALIPLPPNTNEGIVNRVRIGAMEAYEYIRADPIPRGIAVASVGIIALYGLFRIREQQNQQGGVLHTIRSRKYASTRRRFKKLTKRKNLKKSRRNGRRS